jgi:hypothetical protein
VEEIGRQAPMTVDAFVTKQRGALVRANEGSGDCDEYDGRAGADAGDW